MLDEAHALPGHPPPPPNPVALVLRYLRGRIAVAVVLGAVFAVLGAAGGYLATKPLYTSTGLLRVSPTQPVVLYKTEDNQPIPFFDSFVATQAAILSSRRIVTAAVQDEALQKAGWPAGDEGLRLLTKALSVGAPKRGGEIISVEVTEKNPGACAAAVNAVLDAFEKIQVDQAARESRDQETLLERRAESARLQRNLAQKQASDLASPFNADSLAALIDTRTQDLAQVESRVVELEIAAAAAGPDPASPEGPPDPATPIDDAALRAALIAADPSFADLASREAARQTELDVLLRTLGTRHRTFQRVSDELAVLRAQVEQRLAEARAAAASGSAPVAAAQVSPAEEARVQLAQSTSIRDRLRAEVGQLTANLERIREYQRAAADHDATLQEATRRLDQLRTERQQSSVARVEVIQRGDSPLRPSKDRRVPLAVVGGMGGAGFGVGLVVLLGLAQGRVRYTVELEADHKSRPLLGSIPDLRNPEGNAVAALVVHHLRSMLEARTKRESGRAAVYAVTSPTSGEGKTSVAASLAASFGVSGHRVLVVDADLVGRSLTRSLGLAEAKGLEEATTNGDAGSVHSTRFRNVWAMPTGCVSEFEPESLSAGAFHRLVERLRGDFDTVVIDTGPILGSLEANVACAASDHVVMVVGRGQKSRLVNAAVNAVSRVGGDCIGLVFNRATMADLSRSQSSASIGSLRSRRNGTDHRPGVLLEAMGGSSEPPAGAGGRDAT